MKRTSLFKGIEKATIKLSKNRLFSVRGKNIQINCLYGDLWVTWPKNGERILKGGQTFRISPRGKVCIVALSNAFFQMSKRRWYANSQIYGGSGATNEDVDIIPFSFKSYGFLNRIKRA